MAMNTLQSTVKGLAFKKILLIAAIVASLPMLAGCPVNNQPGPKNPPLVPEPKALIA